VLGPREGNHGIAQCRPAIEEGSDFADSRSGPHDGSFFLWNEQKNLVQADAFISKKVGRMRAE